VSSEATLQRASENTLLRHRRQSLAANSYAAEIVTLVRTVKRSYYVDVVTLQSADTFLRQAQLKISGTGFFPPTDVYREIVKISVTRSL